MKEWTLEQRYRVLEDTKDIEELYEQIKLSYFRQQYHIQPVTGLSSDPNGFIYHKGTWHLFYQWCPWGAVHGLKYWYHVSSTDLVHWKNEGVGLKADTIYDNKGCHSGSGIAEGDDLYLFYTGNHRDENWVRTPYTCVAKMREDGSLEKRSEPLFGPRDDYAEHQRDPKVVYNKDKNKYYIFIGAMTQDQRGTALIYESENLLEGWKFAGQLKVPGYENFGGMWECPCIANISGKDVLVFSPQYTKLPGRGESTNHNVYLVGKMDYDTLTFTPETDYRYLDFGFDFYAAQMAANVTDPDKAIMITWIGLPDNHYPTEEEDWEGTMTLARELRLKDNRLIQNPVPEITTLRDGQAEANGRIPETCEIIINVGEGEFDFTLFSKDNGHGGMTFKYDPIKKVVTIDRTGMDKRFNEKVFEVLDMPLEDDLKTLRIFVDKSSIEIFANDGEATFTSRIFPNRREHFYKISDNAEITIYKLKPSVSDNFVI